MREHRLFGNLPKSFSGLFVIPWLGPLKQGRNKDGSKKDGSCKRLASANECKRVAVLLGLCQLAAEPVQAVHARVLTANSRMAKLTRKNHVFTWDLGCEHAFQWVKKALANAPVLAHPDFTKQFTVWTNASIDDVGAVSQQDKIPIAYESTRFSRAERNHTIGEHELLAGIHALKKWRVYLEGAQHPIRLKTDHVHQPLTYLLT